MPHEVAALPFEPHRLEGLSERLLVSHYENNYGGAVRRLNAIEALFMANGGVLHPDQRLVVT